MKGSLVVLMICVLFASMSVTTAINTSIGKTLNSKTQTLINESVSILEDIRYKKPVGDWDGEFVGAYGRVITTDQGRDFEKYGYIAGVYNGDNRGKIFGNLYNLDKEKIGSFGAYFGDMYLIGKVKNMEGKHVPIVGFLLHNETMFFGRVMSLFGPAPHIIGRYWAT